MLGLKRSSSRNKLLCLAALLSVVSVFVFAFAHVQAAQSVVAEPPASVSSSLTLTPRVYLPLVMTSQPPASRIGPVTALAASVPLYSKFEVAFEISTTARNMYFPYDPAAPIESGVTVDMLLTTPDGLTKTVPCFYYQPVDANNLTPVGAPDWRCRYAPETIGTWTYHIHLIDEAGEAESAPQTFTATASTNHGFVRVSPTDTHYFEFDDGTPFLSPLVNVESDNPLNSLDLIRANIPAWDQKGVGFVRWFPTGEGANYFVIPYGDSIASSWGFGPSGVSIEGDASMGQLFSFKPYYWTNQSVATTPGATYRLTLRAKVTGAKVFRPQIDENTPLQITASGWQTYTLTAAVSSNSTIIWLHDGFSESDNMTGTIRVYGLTFQRDLGDGQYGPNLLTRGDPDTFKYVDQIGAARLDEVMRLSEQAGVYHKLTLFHKNDEVLGQLAADGSVTTTWDINNFYTSSGTVVRAYEQAYARYFVARWSYSTALHSLELANENMLTQNSYNAAFDILGYVRSIAPRHILLSNSFWGYFVTEFWTDPTHGNLMDYADKHWYARASSGDTELVSTTYADSAGNVRECQLKFKDYRAWYSQNKPIVRGETGVWQPGVTDPLALGTGALTYYHKQLWAQMGDQCAGEWYTAYLSDQNQWGMFALYNQFLQGEPLTNGHYGDVGTDTGVITVTNASGSVRAWGKIDVLNGRGILWIDNANDTWQNVANGASIAPTSATLTLGGLPNGTYDVSWYDTTSGAVATNTPTVSNGRLALTVSALQHDVAVKFKKY